MSPVGFLVLASSASLIVQVVHTKKECAFFAEQTTLVPGGDSHTVSLTFSVVNMCTNNAMTSIQVSKMNTDTFYPHRICNLSFKDTYWIGGSDCVYKEPSQTFYVTSYSDNYDNETWILVGVLQNGDTFNKTVQMRTPDLAVPTTQTPFVVVVSASVGSFVFMIVIIIVIVHCVRKKRCVATQVASRQPQVSCADTYYLHPIISGAALGPSSTKDSGSRPKHCLLQSDADEDGYTFPDLRRSAGRKRDVPKPVYNNTEVVTEGGDTATPSPKGTSKHNDDGYILPDRVDPDERKRGVVQCLNENIDSTTKRSDEGRAPRSHKYDDDGYVAPNPADPNQPGQESNTSLYINMNPVIGRAQTSLNDFDDDGYVMSDPPERREGKGAASEALYQNTLN